jgi:hypothetical protein
MDLYSTDGGVNWSTYNVSTADKTITSAISFYYDWYGNIGLGTQVVGPLQTTSFGSSGTPTSNWGSRNTTSPNPPQNLPINYYWATYVDAASSYLFTSWQDMQVTPATGGNGVYTGWKAGEFHTFDHASVPHWTANGAYEPRVSLLITGVKTPETEDFLYRARTQQTVTA